jgi:hypothetical protein
MTEPQTSTPTVETPQAPAKPDSQTFLQSFRSAAEERRLQESTKIVKKHPGRLPIIVVPNSAKAPSINNHKYIVPKDIPLGQFMAIIRSKMSMDPKEALYLFISDQKLMCSPTNMIDVLYNQYKHPDGYLYVYYDLESTFGYQEVY